MNEDDDRDGGREESTAAGAAGGTEPDGGATTPLSAVTDSWTDVSRHVLNSYAEANRAIIASLGLAPSETGEDQTAAPIAELSYATAGWEFERSVDAREDVGVGDYVRFTKPLTDGDVHAFAQASGDTNRLHLDDEFASRTRFGRRIVHGTLVAGMISAALARLPGLTIYLSEDVEFHRPVDVGDVVTAECEVVEDLGDHKYRLSTTVVTAEGETVIEGESVVLVDELPEP